MHPLRVEVVTADLCPGCSGMWFDAGELSRAAGIVVRESPSGANLAGGRRTAHNCPCCAVPLYEREIESGSGIRIDQCVNCAGLFLDRGEFAQVRACPL